MMMSETASSSARDHCRGMPSKSGLDSKAKGRYSQAVHQMRPPPWNADHQQGECYFENRHHRPAPVRQVHHIRALTRAGAPAGHSGESRIGTMAVPDARIDTLSAMYKPRKTIYAQVEYFRPADRPPARKCPGSRASGTRSGLRRLIHVVRNFTVFGGQPPAPVEVSPNWTRN
jgi:hypothetical protein